MVVEQLIAGLDLVRVAAKARSPAERAAITPVLPCARPFIQKTPRTRGFAAGFSTRVAPFSVVKASRQNSALIAIGRENTTC